jgi:hypothetical protein
MRTSGADCTWIKFSPVSEPGVRINPLVMPPIGESGESLHADAVNRILLEKETFMNYAA